VIVLLPVLFYRISAASEDEKQRASARSFSAFFPLSHPLDNGAFRCRFSLPSNRGEIAIANSGVPECVERCQQKIKIVCNQLPSERARRPDASFLRDSGRLGINYRRQRGRAVCAFQFPPASDTMPSSRRLHSPRTPLHIVHRNIDLTLVHGPFPFLHCRN
jgi:hypothetical protein